MLLSLLEKRRSIRRFTNKPVPREKIDYLIECALRSPSSRGLNPWEFIIVEDKKTLSLLSRSKPHGASFLKDAPLGIVICADPGRCDVWIEDASIATILIHLAAADLGLASCWIQVRKRMHDEKQKAEEYIKGLLKIPEPCRVLSMVAIGYPDEEKEGHSRASLNFEKIHREEW